jgi:hypothetical protein
VKIGFTSECENPNPRKRGFEIEIEIEIEEKRLWKMEKGVSECDRKKNRIHK